MLGLSKDFNLRDWISTIILAAPSSLPLLARAQKGSTLESDEISFYTTKQIPRTGIVQTEVQVAGTSIVVNQELADRLTEGYLLLNGDEIIKVKSVDRSTKTLTVERGYANTPATKILANTTIKILSKAEKEGRITEDFHKLEKVRSTNVCQTFTKSVNVSIEAASLQKKDYLDLLQEERVGKIDEEGIEINTSLYYGRKKIADDGRRSMGGWKEAIINDGGIVFDAAKDLTHEKLEQVLVSVATRQGKPTRIFLNHTTRAKVFKAFKDNAKIFNNNQWDIKGGGIMTGYLSDALGTELLFEVDDCLLNGDIFIGKGEPVIHTMVDAVENVDVLFHVYKEPSSSAEVNETVKTTMTAEFHNAYQDVYISNAC